MQRLRQLRELQDQLNRIEANRLSQVDVFGTLDYEPTPKQQEFHDATEFDVLYGGAAGGGKLLSVDTPIPTPSGWTVMGLLQVGDQVFDETGAPTTVTFVSAVEDHPVAYRLTFDDGATIEADADHEWLTFDASELAALTRRTPEWRERRRARRKSTATGQQSEAFTAAVTARNRARIGVGALPEPTGSVRTTKEIAQTLRTPQGRSNHAIPVAGALDLPHADLPIDPYVLGAWLGDGHSTGAGFTSADEFIVDQFRQQGITVSDRRSDAAPYAYWLGDRAWGARANGRPGWVNTWTEQLRSLGIEGHKHVPPMYLRASIEQRLALLQGLMDTDGTVNANGQVEFTTTSTALGRDVHELIVSLGCKVRIREHPATLYGKDCGTRWTFKWTADWPVFRLPRKLERQKLSVRRVTKFRYIKECREIEPTPMRCIAVSNPSRLYLAGGAMVPTHNTKALVMHAIRECVRYPGIRVGAFRRTYGELKESLLAELALTGYAKALGAHWKGTDYELRFPNGSVIMFRYAETMSDATRRLGGQYQLLLFDERTLTNPDVVSFLESRMRSGREDIPVLGIRSATNPGGPGHTAVKDRYIKPTNYGEKVVIDQRNREVRFIPSRLSDNPHVNPEYASDLLALPEKLRAAYLDGDWDVFAGQMFPEWSRDRHVVAPRELPVSWRRYAGIDWGYTAPWAVVWAAVDEDGRVWVYREIYEKEVGEADQARRILAAEADEYVIARYADDAMWATRGDALPIAQVYANNGCALTPAGKGPGSRITGWQRIHSYLAEAPACPEHRERGWETCPRLHAFSTLDRFATGIADLPHSPTGNPEDADTRADDHIADATRYLMVNIGNEARWHFPSFGPAQQTGPRAIDPQATDPNPSRPRPLPQEFGGFPVLNQAAHPWEVGHPWAG